MVISARDKESITVGNRYMSKKEQDELALKLLTKENRRAAKNQVIDEDVADERDREEEEKSKKDNKNKIKPGEFYEREKKF